jgi:alginate O-acetyltransferase complex protein AlgI
MIFSDPAFFALFAACAVAFFSVPRQARIWVLLVSGALFYVFYAGIFLAAVAAFTIAAVAARTRLHHLVVGAAIVATLVYFKRPGVAVPLGFSYLAFELLHLLTERRRRRIPEAGYVDTLAYILFMPTRVAGPIRRYPQFTSAVAAAELRADNVYAGVVRIVIGFAKKIVIADTLALTATELGYVQTAAHAWYLVLAYALRIYLDFSAYSDIAIGLSRILGIEVPENFSNPYFAASIRDFWSRWHITLSTWVRDYVFVPLSRRLFATPLRQWPSLIAAISYLMTFVLVGAWHGLTPGFLMWGAYQGLLLGAHHVWRALLPAAVATHRWYHSRAATAISVAVTFVFVVIGWPLFMTDLTTARRLLSLMFLGGAR